MANLNDRLKLLRELLAERIVLLDGAGGTSIQGMHLGPADFGGPNLEGCNENLVRTRPSKLRELHRSFLEAGADVIETNSFGGTSVVLDEYGLAHDACELNRIAARLAREEADAASTPGRPRFVIGSMGPTTKSISVTGGISFDRLFAVHPGQARWRLGGSRDVLVLRTVQDT